MFYQQMLNERIFKLGGVLYVKRRRFDCRTLCILLLRHRLLQRLILLLRYRRLIFGCR